MRHLKSGRRLGVSTSHRKAMMRNMVTSILENGQVQCTLVRAKEVRKPLEHMITLGKRGDLHARRQAWRFVKSKEAIANLFGELAERYKDRNGGYSRLIKLGKRRLGDAAEMAIIQLIDSEHDVLTNLKSKKKRKEEAALKKSVLTEVSQEISSETDKQLDIATETDKQLDIATSQNNQIEEKKDASA